MSYSRRGMGQIANPLSADFWNPFGASTPAPSTPSSISSSPWSAPGSSPVDTSGLTVGSPGTMVSSDELMAAFNAQVPLLAGQSAADQSIIANWGAPTSQQLAAAEAPTPSSGLILGLLVLAGVLFGVAVIK